MAIGLKKLAAGSGYEYLTKQVAAMDGASPARMTLADYYIAKGEAPGQWHGSGFTSLGLKPGDLVTADQMKWLFGAGLHPVTGAPLGQRYAVFTNTPTVFDLELGRRLDAWRAANGLAGSAPVPKDVRDGLRTALAREWFVAQFGRQASGPREIHGFIARAVSRPRVAVAGYDVTFSPAKSVSALWALAEPRLAASIRAAHEAAVADALAFVETRVAFTRRGHNGIRQVNVRGLVAAVFVHRDSRTGDPDLHSHVAIANKVQTLDGKWMAIDGRVLHQAKVTASEEYTTSLQARLAELGIRFVPVVRDGKRPVWEIAGVPTALLAAWSRRRAQVDVKTRELVAAFEAAHERPPTVAEKLDLAQQATLSSRPDKHAPRSEADQRSVWRAQADRLLGPGAVNRVLATIVRAPERTAVVTVEWLARTTEQVVATIEDQQATWREWHVRSEALRQVRAGGIALEQIQPVTDRIVAMALSPAFAVRIASSRALPDEPDLLRRIDGSSVYEVAGGTLYTSARILNAEHRLIQAAGRLDGRFADANSVTLALLQSMANGETLNPGQQHLVTDMATSGRRVQLGIAPAGTGKTTAMRALAAAWTYSGGTILGLAPSATAADQLAHHLPAAPQVIGAETLAKLAWDLGHGGALAEAIGRRTLLIIDEAGMADTLTLDKVVQHALARGASVRLVGDDQQLGAIGAGGVLRDIAAQHGAHRLVAVLRFAHPAEADASLALRTGTRDSLGFYYDHGRVHATDPATATQNLFTAWLTDTRAGRDALMLAPTRALVAELNHAARQARLANGLPGREVLLSDGNAASVGDTILTRRNDRALVDGDTRWVRNGDRWQITRIRRAGSVDARNLRTGGRVTLPADYLARSVELGYATTIHGAQGVTADTCHGIVTGAETRQQLYTALTRGRHANHAWVQVTTGDPTHLAPADQDLHAARPVDDILEAVLARDDAPVSATAQLAQADNPVKLLGHAVACYLDAIGFAAEHHLTDQTQRAIDEAGDRYGFDQAEAWPTLRAHLALFAANGHHPAAVLAEAVGRGGLETAHDPAAVVDWRLDLTEANHRTRGPLPWLPGIPTQLLDSPVWKSYLSQRYQLARHLVDEADAFVKAAPPPAWAGRVPAVLDPGTIADIEIWRAAHLVPDSDLRPTGPAQHHPAEAAVQHLLDLDIQGAALDVTHWTSQASLAAPAVACDPDLVVLGMRLARLAGTRSDIALLLADAARQGALPDDRPAAALGYRVTALAATTAEPDIDVWEVIQSPAPADRARSFEHQMPPPAHHPDRGPGIGH